VHVCGSWLAVGGQKDSRLLQLDLQIWKRTVFISPVDVSRCYVRTGPRASHKIIPSKNCFPVVCDLAKGDQTSESFLRVGNSISAIRIITFFGMLPKSSRAGIDSHEKLKSFAESQWISCWSAPTSRPDLIMRRSAQTSLNTALR